MLQSMLRFRFSNLLFLILLVFCGCGKSENGKEWRIAIDPLWYSINMPDRNREMSAFSNDLLQEVSVLQKIKIVKVRENWDNMLSRLQKGEYEGILYSMEPYLFYEKQYDFSEPFLLTGPVLVVPYTSKITSLSELSGKEIAVIQGAESELVVEKYPGVIIRQFDSIPDAMNALVFQAVDAAVIDVLRASAYCQDLYQGKLKVVGSPLTNEGLRLITLHDQAPELIAAFNTTLHELHKNHKYDALLRKWRLK